jgi:hypothetical protein
MAVLNKGHDFSDGDQVTADKLDAAVDAATFATGAVDNASTQLSGGAIIVKDAGITAAKIAANAVTTDKILDANVTTAKIVANAVTTAKILDANVTTAKIADSNVTKTKIENVADMKVLGNTSGVAAAPSEVSILDEDNLVSNSATALATQQSIKAYVDNKSATTQSLTQNGYQVFPSGLIIQWGVKSNVSESSISVANFPIAFPNACLNATATARNSSGGNTASFDYFSQVVSFNTTSLTLKSQNLGSSTDSTYWQAIGY